MPRSAVANVRSCNGSATDAMMTSASIEAKKILRTTWPPMQAMVNYQGRHSNADGGRCIVMGKSASVFVLKLMRRTVQSYGKFSLF